MKVLFLISVISAVFCASALAQKGETGNNCLLHLQYPSKAKKYGLEGKVTVRYQIMENGSVGEICIIKSTRKIFEQPVMDALHECIFPPAYDRNGKPISVWAKQPIEFRLDSSDRKHKGTSQRATPDAIEITDH